MGGDTSFPDLKSDAEDISGCSMEQIEEMILGIFKNNSGGSKKVPSLNIDNLNFGYEDADSFDCPVTDEKKNKVFETVKEPKIKHKKSKYSHHISNGHGASSSRDSNLNNLNQKNINGSNYLAGGLQAGLQGLPNMTDDNLNLLLAGMGMPMGGLNFGNTGLPNMSNMQNMSNLSNMQNMFPVNTNNLSNEQLMQIWNTLNAAQGSINPKQNENLCNSLLSQLFGSEGVNANNDELLMNLAKTMGMNLRPEDMLAHLNSGMSGMTGMPIPAGNQQIPAFPNNNSSKSSLGNSGNMNENMFGMNPLGLGNMFPGGMSDVNHLLSSLGMGGLGDANMDYLMASLLQGGASQPSNQGNNIINNYPTNINSQNIQNTHNTPSLQGQVNAGAGNIPSSNINANNMTNLPNLQNLGQNSQILQNSSNINENLMQMYSLSPPELNSNQTQSTPLNNNQTHIPANLNKSVALDTDCSGANKNLQNAQTGKENSATNPSQLQGGQLSQAANDELNYLQQFGDVLKIISGSGIGTNNSGSQLPYMTQLTNLPINDLNNTDVLPTPTIKIEEQDNLSSLNNLMMNPMNAMNPLNPLKPNENILGDDNSMNMVLNFLNQGGHSNMDLNNLIQFLDMNHGVGGNSLANMLNQTQSQSQTQVQNNLMPNFTNINAMAMNPNQSQNAKKESSQKDLDKTLEEKEDSTNGNKSQSGNISGAGMMNNPFAFMGNPNEQNFNLGLGVPGMPVNNMNMNNNLLSDPIFGMMNQFLMGQPQQPNLSNMPNLPTPNYKTTFRIEPIKNFILNIN
jgi:hypothetical protein